MKLSFAVTLVATLAATSVQAQISQPQNGQLNSQVNSQLNSQVGAPVNTGVSAGVSAPLPGSTITNGVGTARTQAPLGATQPGTLGRTGAEIGTPGVTAPLGTIDNRTGTTSVTNASGSSLLPATGSSAPLNNGSWGGMNPNNTLTLTPAASGTALGTPGLSGGGAATGAASGAPTGR